MRARREGGRVTWEDPVTQREGEIEVDGEQFCVSGETERHAFAQWLRVSDAGIVGEWLIRSGGECRAGTWTIDGGGLPLFVENNGGKTDE